MFGEEQFPFEICDLSEEERHITEKIYTEEFVKVGEKKWFTRASFAKYGPEFYNFPLKSDDVWLLGYNRSGTTVAQEIVWLMCNNLDTDKARKIPVRERFPTLEHILYFDEGTSLTKYYRELFHTDEKRFIKSHLPFSLLPKKLSNFGCKVIYLIRDPRDVIVSNYSIYEKFSKIKPFVDFSFFWKAFKENLVLWAPYFDHLKETWDLRQNKNLLIIFYNDLINNQRETIKKIGRFLGKELTNENIDRISEYCKTSFNKNNTADNEEMFVKVEQKWKQYFINDLQTEVTEWIENNLKDTNSLLIHFK